MSKFKIEDLLCGMPADVCTDSNTAPITVGTLKEMCDEIAKLEAAVEKATRLIAYAIGDASDGKAMEMAEWIRKYGEGLDD